MIEIAIELKYPKICDDDYLSAVRDECYDRVEAASK
jgi:hypothetical protein